jgi:hypothetical protein
MSDSLLEDEKLTTADIARPATPRQMRAESMNRDQDQRDRLETTDNRPIPLPTGTASNADPGNNANVANANNGSPSLTDAGALFPDDELHNYRARWDQVQTSFVDEPRQAVEQADSLVANVVKRIAEQFSNERSKLENQWASGDNVSTEDLRQALRRYRSFFDRLLSF